MEVLLFSYIVGVDAVLGGVDQSDVVFEVWAVVSEKHSRRGRDKQGGGVWDYRTASSLRAP